jgi:CheY-like chemotaxis protein
VDADELGKPEPVLILLPTECDASVAVACLHEMGIRTYICHTIEIFCTWLDVAAAGLIAEEALSAQALDLLLPTLQRQPLWSDVPLILLTTGANTTEPMQQFMQALGAVGNIMLLARPLQRVMLLSTIRAALRTRRRQHEIRQLHDALQRRIAEQATMLEQLHNSEPQAVEGHGGSSPIPSRPEPDTPAPIALPAPAPVAPAAPVPAQRGTILLIDDEPGMRRVLRRLLQRSGYEVTTATNGREGLLALQAHAYEVILCDMRMPDLDGPGFYRELEHHYPHLLSRLVFVTGDTLSAESQAFFTQVDCPCLIKPFKAEEVRRVIQQVLAAR